MEINKVKIGKRFRKDIGELETLKASIKEIGLLQPIVIDEKNNLIAGQRRLIACKELGMKDIKTNVIEIENTLRGEYDENVIRKGFTPSEEVAIWDAMESHQGQLRSDSDQSQRRKKASKLLGKGTDTLSKAKQVVKSGDKELIEKMDRTGNVNGAYRQIARKNFTGEVPKIPEGKYEVIYADCPWRYNTDFSRKAVEGHYPTMDIQALCDFGEKVKEISAQNCICFFWVTSPILEDAFKVINAWGFQYKTSIVWDKVKYNMGYYSSARHEFLLVAGKGIATPKCDGKTIQSIDSVQSIPKSNRHSEKPEEFREIIEKLYPGTKKIELFSRKKVKGWASFGNEAK